MKTKFGLIFILFFLIIFVTCQKDKDDPAGSNKIELGGNLIDTVSYFFTDIQTEVISLGGNEIIQHGHCWNTAPNPSVNEYHTWLGKLNTDIDFLSRIDSLQPNTIYYIRPYIQTAYAVVYGDEDQIKTLKTGKPVVNTNMVSEITLISAISGGNVISDSGLTVISRGVCWDTTGIFRIDSCLGFTIDSLGLGDFLSEVTSLHEGTNYHLAAYATNEKGTGYGEVKVFTTIPITPPEVMTSDIINITTISAQCGGNVLSGGNGTVTVRGVCWDTLSTPTLGNNLGHTIDGNGLGEFISNITNLHEGKTYYIAAYATNEKSTGYGEVKSFSTTPIITPQITTANITGITITSAQCGGNVTNNGNGLVNLRGVCWNNTGNPTIINSIGHTEDGGGLGTFISNITGLEDGVIYFVTAYATNENETGYGEIKSFTTLTLTLPTVTTSSVTDITTTSAVCGGNVTSSGNGTVSLRGVCWNTTGDPTLQNCIDSTSNGGGTGNFVSQITGLVTGTQYFVRAYATNQEGTVYGNQMPFTTKSVPIVVTTAVTNISYTTATSGGNVTSDGGSPVTARGVCWSTTQNPTTSDPHTTNGTGTGNFVSNITGLTQNTTYYVRSYATNSIGTAYGNELLFTTLQITLPSIITSPVTNITATTATSGGNVTDDGGVPVIARGVCWSTLPNPTISDNFTINGSGIGSFVSSITGLEYNTDYYVRAYATNIIGISYGNEVSFTTLPNPWQCGDQIIYEEQTYNTVQINTQCWFKENLNVGDKLITLLNELPSNNGIIEKFCFDDNTAYCTSRGGLYTWNEMMQYTATPGGQGICPSGWHIPTDAEYTLLTDFLGGLSIAGGKMKETGTTHWKSPNTGATNSSGFTAIPHGGWYPNYFSIPSEQLYLWTSSPNVASKFTRSLSYDSEEVFIGSADEEDRGFSVRCLKDE